MLSEFSFYNTLSEYFRVFITDVRFLMQFPIEMRIFWEILSRLMKYFFALNLQPDSFFLRLKIIVHHQTPALQPNLMVLFSCGNNEEILMLWVLTSLQN